MKIEWIAIVFYQNVSTSQLIFSLFDFRGRWYVHIGKWYVLIYQGIVTMFVLMNFSLATFMDPGVIPRGNKIDFVMLKALCFETYRM